LAWVFTIGDNPASPLRQFSVMGDDNDRDTLPVQIFKEPVDPFRGDRVKVSCRLISKQDPGIIHECPRNCYPLHLATAELTRKMFHPVREPYFFE
jgi:hypothetical protein